ncbi:LuxR C-terminal-related transcriptional regulator [Streptomyces sp. ME19-01-6]|uniref:LuxR C-terminal-related transcriptional regulator n=1 Tax=Streptomyces sp. ME19-01-6 TaxID=3028686 RepID=UPI0029AECA8B|nr:LuxR C-terminal-related transcriptional regulator [Streptomyces sp. ME19-01-6]MDX3233972.1 LuxR C-terminal-related transcriptional regulator [Streptomyces sp. ME19-01-6]
MRTSPALDGAQAQFTSGLATALSVEEVGRAFLSQAANLLDADALGMYRLGSDSAPLEVLSAGDYGFLELYEEIGRSDDPVLDFVLNQQRPIDSSRVVSGHRWAQSGARAALGEGDLAHSLEAPIVVSGEVVGTINFARVDRAPFSSTDLASARFVSEQLSLAIERAYRFEETRTRLEILEATMDRLPQGVVISDQDTRPIFINRAAGRWLKNVGGASRRSTGHRELESHLDDAVNAFRAGKRVHASSTKNDASSRFIVKSYSLGEKKKAVVSILSSAARPGTNTPPRLAVLSPREQEIANMVAEGLSAQRIAERVHISENTVKQHLKRIFVKTDVRSRAELVHLLWTAGHGDEPDDLGD